MNFINNDFLGEYTPLLYYLTLILWLVMNNIFIEIFEEKEIIKLYKITLLSIILMMIPVNLSPYIRIYYRYAIITWGAFAYIIIEDNKTLMLSYPLILFYSEFYEIPIYIGRIIKGIILNGQTDILLIGVKISILIIIDWMMNHYDYDNNKFIRSLFSFMLVYTPLSMVIVYYVYDVMKYDYVSVIILKFICLIHFKYVIGKVRT